MKTLLVANRGEIAIQIIKKCKEMGLRSAAVYSTADKDSMHVKMADCAICVGPGNSVDSYLNIPAILSACRMVNADYLHPGYGFLSESRYLPKLCEDYQINFVGPPVNAIITMGDKMAAKAFVQNLQIPVIPGSHAAFEDAEEAFSCAQQLGFPLLLKAAEGGGGKGIRVALDSQEFTNQFILAQREATRSFGASKIYLEAKLEGFRHIEVQVMADQHGNVHVLGERDCTMQLNKQKIIEETPSAADWAGDALLEKLRQAAKKIAQGLGYHSLGTVEFMVNEENYYFMEMNPRIQVEYPVTEMVTGIDLLKIQIQIAMGKAFKNIYLDRNKRYAMQCRIKAEDPLRLGRSPLNIIEQLFFPSGFGVRVDSHICAGMQYTHFYDSLLAKVIVSGDSRREVIDKMCAALEGTVIKGMQTNIKFLLSVLKLEDFVSGQYGTDFLQGFVEEYME